MFESVLSRRDRTGRFLGGGALVSLVVHVAVGGGVWALSGDKEPPKKKEKPADVTLVQQTLPPPPPVVDLLPPPPPPPPPPPAPEAPKVEPQTPKVEPEKPKVEKPKPKKVEAPPDTMVKAPDKPTEPEPPPEPKPGGGDAAAGAQPTGQEGGQEGGKEGGVIGGKVGGVIGGKVGGTGSATEVVPFGEGMARPKRLSGDEPRYSREALEAGVQGVMIVKCVIEVDGRLENCRVIKPLPYMEKAVLDALGTHRYSPVTFQGRPVRVDYTFTIKLVVPQ